MVQIPESVRPTWDFVAKYHFWLLTPLVPILLLPALLLTNGKLSAEMAAKRSEIDGKLSALRQIDGITPHPNDTWTSDIDKRTARVKRETLVEWQRLWESQRELRLWPAETDPELLQRLTNLRPGQELKKPMLERYTQFVRDQAMKLPGRMGADMLMAAPDALAEGEGAAGAPGMLAGAPPGTQPGGLNPMMAQMMMQGRGGPGGAFGPAGQTRRSTAVVEWDAADQQRVYESFHWDKLPRTKQVFLAQEEMKLYELLCDQVATVNKGARGQYEASIPHVEQLAVGYLAAEDDPAVSTVGRLHTPGAAGAGGPGGMMGMPPSGGGDDGPKLQMGGMPGMPGMPGSGGAGAPAKPLHPRFLPKGDQGGMARMKSMMPPMGGGMADGGGGMPQAPELPANTDEALMTWVYTDADGKPLKGEDVATNPSAVLTLFVPFVIRATIDQRKLDSFLVQMATHPVAPIEIRQVRINPSAQAAAPAGMGGGMGMSMGPPGGMGGPPIGGPGGPMGGGPTVGNRRMPGGMGGPPMGGPGGQAGQPGMRGGVDTSVATAMRPHDILVEIRGTIALATPPDPTRLGLEADAAAEPGPAADADNAAPQDSAPAAAAPTDEAPAADGAAAVEAAAPADVAAPAEGSVPVDGDARADGGAPSEGTAPADETAPPASDAPAGGDGRAPADAPADPPAA